MPISHWLISQKTGDDEELAWEMVLKAIPQARDDGEVQALYGLLLLDRDPAKFASWDASLPQSAHDSPEVWFARGLWLKESKNPKAYAFAARCFWECVRRLPDHGAANYHLGQLLVQLKKPREAAAFAMRANLLQQMNFAYQKIDARPYDAGLKQEAGRLAEELGRIHEAHAHYSLAQDKDASLPGIGDAIRRLKSRLKTADLTRTQPSHNPALQVDLSYLALPDQLRLSRTDSNRGKNRDDSSVAIAFRDTALSAGLEFRYFNGLDKKRPGIRMHETLGGAVAILDFDQDSWPDVYLAQGARVVSKSGNRVTYRDRLFRNLGNGRFADVTEAAGLGDAGHTHSATIGDYNSDGWPDIYLANLGRNRLYRNNGDGTFTDVSDRAGLTTKLWSSACAMADLNGDGHPDLYDVNYLQGQRPLVETCSFKGHVRSCDPAFYDAAKDQLLLSLGDGRMKNVTATAGIDGAVGKGLGVVVAGFGNSGRLSVFVANDGVANHFYNNRATAKVADPIFKETALGWGLALNRRGRGEACMGVAFDDADGDGRFDLFVTNFYKESNTLYRRIGDALFADETRQADLWRPSFRMTGWGTQFLDADLDGWPDLVIANGHVDDFSFEGTPFRMRPQFLRNVGQGRFREHSARSLGPYFQRKLLGRALAKVDWNRDGRPDCIVSHLWAPLALLSNITETKNHWLAIRFRGTNSSRDAIGTVATFTVGDRVIAKQLIAGDGYSASNQRQHIVGLGQHSQIDRLRIRWPSGRVQEFHNVAVDREVLLIEGNSALLPIPK